MKLAIVGGGIFGCTAAILANRAGHEVHLFDKAPELMQGATARNQFRLHRGYHYPRSPKTALECQDALGSFYAEYADAIINGNTIYAIARDGSQTSPAQFLNFCDDVGLSYRAALGTEPIDQYDLLSLAVRVDEDRINFDRLRGIVLNRLAGVNVHVDVEANAAMRDEFDAIVIAAYAGTNSASIALGCGAEQYQFELVEKPVIRLSPKYRDFSMVVMDGPFFSVDPYGETGLHLLGHVDHAIHASNVGLRSVADHKPYLSAGDALDSVTLFPEMAGAAAIVLPMLRDAEHVGSMFVTRAVLPNKEATDERPTLVTRLDDKVIRVFSGKIGTCVAAARQALAMIEGEAQEAA